MFNNIKLPTCPYCGENLSFVQAWGIHKNGEYICESCKNVSRVELSPKTKKYARIAVIISVVFLIISFLISDINIFEVILCIIPFLIFYFMVPYNIILFERTVKRSERSVRRNEYEDIKENKELMQDLERMIEQEGKTQRLKRQRVRTREDKKGHTRVF